MTCNCCDITVVPTENVITVVTASNVIGLTTTFVRVLGSVFSGSDGATNRVYTYSANIVNNSVSKTGKWLDSTSEYTLSAGLLVTDRITILTELWNDDYVVFAVNA